MTPPARRKLRLLDSRNLAPDVKQLTLEVLDGPFELEAGQYVCLTKSFGEDLQKLYFSIASAPDGGRRFELCIRPNQNGSLLGSYLWEMQPGGEVECEGPEGEFVLRRPLSDAVFLATGTGVAPVRAMLQSLFPPSGPVAESLRFVLIHGVREGGELLYREEFERMQERHKKFEYWPTLSRPAPEWKQRRGYVQEHLDEALDPSLKAGAEVDVYVCGHQAMVRDVAARLLDRGFDHTSIIHERHVWEAVSELYQHS